MRRWFVVIGLGFGLSAVPNTGHAQEYVRPRCSISRGHFLVSQAETYVKGGSEESDPDTRRRLFMDAQRTLNEALDRGQVENAAVWYFLGRTYFELDDPLGMDSAFSRTVRLEPDCEEEALYYRNLMWVPMYNSAVDSMQAGAFEDAKELFRRAGDLKPSDNISFYYLARIFAMEGEIDSALTYFKQVVDIEPTEAQREENVTEAINSIANLHHVMMEWDSSIVWNERRRELQPDNAEVLTVLAQAYAETGNDDRAAELYNAVFANAANLTYLQLFEAGEQLYLAEQFALSAQAFDLGVEKNPYNRQGIYYLVISYRSIAEDDGVSENERSEAAGKMADAAARLVDVDPLSSEALNLLAEAYRLTMRDADADRVVARMNELTFEIEIFYAESANGVYQVQGRFRNMRDGSTDVPTITFEFLDAGGNVVGSETAGGESLAAGDAANFAVTGQGEIIAYRYKAN
jgi:cytochrome c-type biogenesis protein CcmH/NrfG